MRNKSDLYREEQILIVDKLIDILKFIKNDITFINNTFTKNKNNYNSNSNSMNKALDINDILYIDKYKLPEI